jgi:acetylornithine/succinyldiaminopimelate/putrescine aminotransferase
MNNRQLFLQHQAQTSDTPLAIEITHAQGMYMYTPDGKKIMDLISGIGVSSVGHCHPKVVEAVQQQAAKHMHLMVYGELIQQPQTQLAHKLCNTLSNSLNACYLVNSGSEAIEGAIKLAKRATGKFEIISCYNAYHGSTQGALSIMGNEQFKQAFRPLIPGNRHIRYNQLDDLSYITEQTAAVVIETIQGEAGVRIADKNYFIQLAARCKETNTLLILDEVQCGFGRTGTFWAFESYGIVPDVLVTAKAMGGGMPIGAFIANQHLMQTLSHEPILGHITTFGGHPVSCAASIATIEILQEEQLIEQVSAKAQRLVNGLKHSAIKEIRHAGLMMAVQYDDYPQLKKYIDKAIDKGLLTDWFLFCDNAMRIAPPLTISNDEIDQVIDIINGL